MTGANVDVEDTVVLRRIAAVQIQLTERPRQTVRETWAPFGGDAFYPTTSIERFLLSLDRLLVARLIETKQLGLSPDSLVFTTVTRRSFSKSANGVRLTEAGWERIDVVPEREVSIRFLGAKR